jgi:dTDP-4-amino-4,6-dideoxygalactose transaminase
MATIRELADRRQLVVIEDACHALGATYRGRPIGGSGTADLVCFSFHPVKHVTTGEGGAVLTDDEALAREVRKLRHHGIERSAEKRPDGEGPWYCEIPRFGLNARITDIQCAIGSAQLDRLDGFLERRRAIASRYRAALEGIAGVAVQSTGERCEHAYHLFVIHLDPALHDRLAVYEELRRRGIGTQVHYVPLHRHPAVARLGNADESFPEADHYYRGCLSLPMYPALTDEDQGRVIAALHEILGGDRGP